MKENAKRVQGFMRSKGIDLLLVSSPENVFYISDVPTSYTASNRLLFGSRRNAPVMCLIPAEGDPLLVFSAAALDIVQKHTWIADLRIYATGTYILREVQPTLAGKDFFAALSQSMNDKINGHGSPKIAIERNDLSALNFEFVQKDFARATFADATDLLMEARMIKNEEEIQRFVKATKILVKVMHKVEDACKDRPTEWDLDIILKSEIMREGAESWQQTTIAAGKVSGPDIYNQPVPKRRIKSGDIIRLDVGCVYKGYCADLSRTYAVEKVPPRAAKTYKVLKDAYLKYIDEIAPGTPSSKINIDIVNYVKQNLDKEYYRGNVGHGVGVELYDRPLLSETDNTPLQSGMTLSYEVPYHIASLGGLNLEDSVLIRGDKKEVVSKYDRDIIIV